MQHVILLQLVYSCATTMQAMALCSANGGLAAVRAL